MSELITTNSQEFFMSTLKAYDLNILNISQLSDEMKQDLATHAKHLYNQLTKSSNPIVEAMKTSLYCFVADLEKENIKITEELYV
jgi:hypothetical protein